MRKAYFILFLFLFLLQANAQSNVVSSGGNATGESGTSSFTIGQAFYHTRVATAFSFSEGLQQPIEITTLQTKEFPTDFSIRVYPNPAVSGFNIILDEFDNNSDYTLVDLNGKKIKSGKLVAKETYVAAENIVSGMYILKIINKDQEHAYKLIKQ